MPLSQIENWCRCAWSADLIRTTKGPAFGLRHKQSEHVNNREDLTIFFQKAALRGMRALRFSAQYPNS